MSFDKSVVPTKKTPKLYSLPITIDDWHRALGFHKCATCGAPVGNGILFAWQGKNRWCEECFWDEDSVNSDELIDFDTLRRRTEMLTTEVIEKAIEMYESGATESAVAKGTGISPEEAKPVVDALYLGETDRLLREIALASALEAAAQALRSDRGLVGDSAADVIREIWHSYPSASLNGESDCKSAGDRGLDRDETANRRLP